MPKLKLDVACDVLSLAKPLRIAGHVFDSWEIILVTLDDGTQIGRGEASGVYFLGEDAEQMRVAIETVRAAIEDGADRGGILKSR